MVTLLLEVGTVARGASQICVIGCVQAFRWLAGDAASRAALASRPEAD